MDNNEEINMSNFGIKLKMDNLKNLEETAKKIASANASTNNSKIETIEKTGEGEKSEEINLEEKVESSLSSLDHLKDLKEISLSLKFSIEKWIDCQSKRDEEIKGKDAISRGKVETKKYTNYYDRSFTIPRATASDPNDFDSSAYAGNSSTTFGAGAAVGRVEIFTDLERYADIIYVANDGSYTLFYVISHGGKTNFSKEEPIYPGEVKCFFHVYELRFRSPTNALPYRVSEYCLNKINTGTTSGGVFTAIEKGVIQNTALPAANTDFFAAALSPTNTPCTFRVMAAISVAGNLNVTITRAGNTQTLTLNVIPGPALVANGIYTFDILVHSGDTINYQYSTTGGTILIFRVQELDATTA